jgi:hypothetical protein
MFWFCGRASALSSVCLLCAACGSAATDAPAAGERCASRFATSVESFSAGPGSAFGQAELPNVVLGPPKGLGETDGSLDVASLGNGGSITLGFAPSAIVDGPGPDFIVFENAFYVASDRTVSNTRRRGEGLRHLRDGH